MDKKEYKDFCKLLRLILTGNKVGPDLFKLMEVLGRDEVIKRIKHSIEIYKKIYANS